MYIWSWMHWESSLLNVSVPHKKNANEWILRGYTGQAQSHYKFVKGIAAEPGFPYLGTNLT